MPDKIAGTTDNVATEDYVCQEALIVTLSGVETADDWTANVADVAPAAIDTACGTLATLGFELVSCI